jgi:hypothetical protein
MMDVEATTTIGQAEVGAAKTMLDRTADSSKSLRCAVNGGGPTFARPFIGSSTYCQAILVSKSSWRSNSVSSPTRMTKASANCG